MEQPERYVVKIRSVISVWWFETVTKRCYPESDFGVNWLQEKCSVFTQVKDSVPTIMAVYLNDLIVKYKTLEMSAGS